MTLDELKNQVSTLVGANWSSEESDEIDSILLAIKSGSESEVRSRIDNLSKCPMLISICERF